tara:strand:- start:1440 stop:2366 length:927 start_codon:yes stop_codon:yes gene_type:complete
LNEEQIFLPEKFDCPTLISFSGGRTSGYMLYKILEAYDGVLPNDVHVTFANTGKEMPQTLDFINDCAVNWNVKVNWLELDIHDERPIYRTKEVTYETASRNGEPFEALIGRKKMLPNPVMRLCTQELKVNVMKRFMKQKGYKEWANVVGLRYDEPKRVTKQRNANESGKNKWTSIVPLYDYKVMIEDVYNFWKNNTFDLNLRNDSGKTLAGNCDLCFLKGKRTLITLLKERPDLADWWISQENRITNNKWNQKFIDKNKGTEQEGNETKLTAQFRKDRSYSDLIKLAELDANQISLFDDDARSCFCHD